MEVIIIVKEIFNKALPGLMTTLIATIITFWLSNIKQLQENKTAITEFEKSLEKLEDLHNKRLDILEKQREKMDDYYVTRREFNIIIQSLDEKMNKVDKNIEKLLDLQMNK